MKELKRCIRCVTPETHETILFNKDGICNICEQQEFKSTSINWSERLLELESLVDQYRNKYDYDCIVPFSGGKDSVWTLYYLVKKLKLKPLVVRFDHGFLRPNLNENTKRVSRELGVDVHHFSPNWKVSQKLMLQSFLEKGDFCWHCHTGIFAYPMQVAIKYKIPLIIWGEPSAEYTAYYRFDQKEEVDEKRFNRYVNLGISAEDMLIRLQGAVNERDLNPFRYPSIKKLQEINCRSICLGTYVPWNVKQQVEIIKKELGWKGDQVENIPSEYNYEKIECYMQGVRDYIKYIKRGYTRPSHLASIDIRNKEISREKGMKLIEKFENKRPPSLDIFLDFIGISEKEFEEIVLQHSVSPYKHDFSEIKNGEKLHDFDKWETKGKMKREDTELQLKRWRARL